MRGRQARALAVLGAGVLVIGLLAGLGINAIRNRSVDTSVGTPTASTQPDPSVATAPGSTPEDRRDGKGDGDGTRDGTRDETRDGTQDGDRDGKSDRTRDGAGDGAGRSVRAWTATLVALDGRRAEAFARMTAGALDQIYVPGSAPWRSDRALLAAYRRDEVRIDGLRIDIRRVGIHRTGATSVILRVMDRFAGGTAVDRAGQRTPLPSGPPTTRLITLTASGKAWRISSIDPA